MDEPSELLSTAPFFHRAHELSGVLNKSAAAEGADESSQREGGGKKYYFSRIFWFKLIEEFFCLF